MSAAIVTAERHGFIRVGVRDKEVKKEGRWEESKESLRKEKEYNEKNLRIKGREKRKLKKRTVADPSGILRLLEFCNEKNSVSQY